MFNIGDRVKVIRSAYTSVKPGTIATIISIKFIDMSRKWVLYILDNPQRCNSFREWELEKYEEE